MDTAAIKAYMNQWLEENKQEFYAVADEIWANPELGLEEYRQITQRALDTYNQQ